RLGKREHSDVDAEESEVQKADARPAQRKGLARRRSSFWRLRTEGYGSGLDYRPPNRGFTCSHHAIHQARRQTLDSHFSGQAFYQEARGNAHGQRQRRSGKVGRGGKAGTHHDRNVRRGRSDGEGSHGFGGAQAADSHEVHYSRGEPVIMPKRIEKIRESGVNELEAQQKELTEQIFRLKFQLSTGQAEALKRLRESKKDLARVKTLLRAQEIAAESKSQAAGKA